MQNDQGVAKGFFVSAPCENQTHENQTHVELGLKLELCT